MVDALFPGASELEGRAIREIAALAMDAPAAAKSGHSGTAMALAPLGVMLYSRILRHDPLDPSWSDRDRFILSCGHASILQYGLAHAFGYDVRPDDLRAFRQAHSRTPGHPENGVTETVEVTTGPLGQGIANGMTTGSTWSTIAPGSSPATDASRKASATRPPRWPDRWASTD